jgi:hypothetical protein
MGGGGVNDFGWRFGVGIRLNGDVNCLIFVALSGSSSILERGGRQMLGVNSRGLSCSEHEVRNEGKEQKCEGEL